MKTSMMMSVLWGTISNAIIVGPVAAEMIDGVTPQGQRESTERIVVEMFNGGQIGETSSFDSTALLEPNSFRLHSESSIESTLANIGTPESANNSFLLLSNLRSDPFPHSVPSPIHAFISPGRGMAELGAFESVNRSAAVVNNAGRAASRSVTDSIVTAGADDSPIHAFIFTESVMRDLGTLGGINSAATGINNSGKIVGYSHTDRSSVPVFDATVSRATNSSGMMISVALRTTDVGNTAAMRIAATKIVESGHVAGYSNVNSIAMPHFHDSSIHAFSSTEGVRTDLGSLGGVHSIATGINQSGQVVGYFNPNGDGVHHAFISTEGLKTDLGTLGGVNTVATGINNSGQIVGYYKPTGESSSFASISGRAIIDESTRPDANRNSKTFDNVIRLVSYTKTIEAVANHAFVYSRGETTDLGTLGGGTSVATGVNDAGQVVGVSTTTGDHAAHAFISSDGVITDLGTLGGLNSAATGINKSGQVVGYSNINPNGNSPIHAFVHVGGAMSDLGTLGGLNSVATAINESGHIVGYSETSLGENSPIHAFVYANGVMKSLGTLGGTNSVATGINDSDQVVGYSQLDRVVPGSSGVDLINLMGGAGSVLGRTGDLLTSPIVPSIGGFMGGGGGGIGGGGGSDKGVGGGGAIVPEHSTLSLMILGGLCLAVMSVRRSRQKARRPDC